MEPHQQHEDSSSGSKNSSFLCRQSSTRWIPTADQIRILRELYYNNGVRSPSAEQIQRISARLRQYGKIEGKNVFYWFQNHKARERQKKRFTHSVDAAMQRGGGVGWKVEGKYCGNSGGSGGCSSPGVLAVGQTGSMGCGSVLMEKSFRECSLTGNNSNYGVGIESSYGLLGNGSSEEREGQIAAIETLQLFPMHGQETAGFCPEKSPGEYFSDWYLDEEDGRGGYGASLELSLTSYATGDYSGTSDSGNLSYRSS